MLWPGEIPSSPYKVAAWPSRPCTLRETCGQKEFSLLREMPRYRMIPQTCSLVAAKRRLLNGISIKTTKSLLVILPREFQTVSKDVSQFPLISPRAASDQIASHCTPS